MNAATGSLPTLDDFKIMLEPISKSQWDAVTFKEMGYTSAGGIRRYIDELLKLFPYRG